MSENWVVQNLQNARRRHLEGHCRYDYANSRAWQDAGHEPS